MINTISILGGHGKSNNHEAVKRIDIKMGDVVSIVGPTGSGKTTLINDLELFAYGNTPTGRNILIDGEVPPAVYRDDPAHKPIAMITQHTTFLSDLPVGEFLAIHARIRNSDPDNIRNMISETLNFANQLTGEPVQINIPMTELSGGQTRALLIADATIICNTPIVLLDEVENAGINRTKALELLRHYRKIFIFVTHDPRIALLSDYRIIMKEGCITQVIHTDDVERKFSVIVSKLDDTLTNMREKIRTGQRLSASELEVFA